MTWNGQGAAEITLTLAGITDAPGQQLTLFDLQDDSRARLTSLLDRLAARFGAEAFRLASLADPDHLLLERRAPSGRGGPDAARHTKGAQSGDKSDALVAARRAGPG